MSAIDGLMDGGAMGGPGFLGKPLEGAMAGNAMCLAGVVEFLKLDGGGGALSIILALQLNGMGWVGDQNLPGIFHHDTPSIGGTVLQNTASLFPGAGATPARPRMKMMG